MAAAAATVGASGVLKSAMYGTASASQGLQTSKSLPTLLPGAARSGAGERLPGVSMDSLMKFLFPARLENPDSCGRLEIFGKFGPCDEDGNLRGGVCGHHTLLDCEVKLMIQHDCREALYNLFLPKARSTVESIVETLMPVAMSHNYTDLQIRRLLRDVPRHRDTGRLQFTALQECIKESQTKRLGELAKRAMGGKPIAPPKERPLKVPFQSKPAYHLQEITRKKKHLPQEEPISQGKRMHAYSTLVASLEDQSLGDAVKMNSIMCRDLGRLDDRWDRYCALRRTGRSSYVTTRNNYRFNPSMDCGLGNKHPGVSSLLAASCGGSSAGALLGAS